MRMRALTFVMGGALLLPIFPELCARSLAADSVDEQRREKCLQGMISINAPSEVEWSFGCDASVAAIARLEECGIKLRRPVSIFVAHSVQTPSGSEVFGFLNPDEGVVSVTALSGLPRLAAGTPYEALPPLSLFKSVVVHETVHAVMEQNYSRKPSSRAAYEYPAYAVQMELLSTELAGTAQTRLLEAENSFLLSDIVLGFNPFLFAARAHKHLQGDTDRCLSLRQSVEDRTGFIVALPY
jgi:hypothetical protein